MYQIVLYFWHHKQKGSKGINTLFLLYVGECPMYTHANFSIYNKEITREEAELFDQPSYISFLIIPGENLQICISFTNN